MSDRSLIHGLARALIDAAQTYEACREWPVALLWPDPERQWSSAFADLRRRLGSQRVALYSYGDYAPDSGVGPSIWLRCLIEAPGAPNCEAQCHKTRCLWFSCPAFRGVTCASR